MKIKAIATICKKSKRIIMYQGQTQWIGDGCSLYPMFNIPQMEMKNTITMFDIPEAKISDYQTSVKEIPTCVNINDSCSNEIKLENIGTCIVFRGAVYQIIPTSSGAKLLNMKYLSPFSDLGEYELFERKNNAGQIFIAVKQGFVLYGILVPEEITEYLEKEMSLIARECKYALEHNKGKSEKGRMEYNQMELGDVETEVEYDEQ